MMEAPLRAFLMLRTEDGVWSVTVCRDLSAVVRAWKDRTDEKKDVAVLHVGFDRPPSKTFDEVADLFPGRMLLSAGAKYTLPSSFVCSAEPVSKSENIEVYAGLQGWGYTLEDPTIDQTPVEPDVAPVVMNEPQGWVLSFLKESPAIEDALSAVGVYDDTSYSVGECKLDRNIRHRMGMFRVHYLVGSNSDDPCAVARASPPWLAERDFVSLGLPVRAGNVFRVNDIKTVSDLASWTSDDLMKQPNFGRKSLKDTLHVLNAALKDGPPLNVKGDEDMESSRLLTEVRRSLLSFADRERDVLVRRLGFETPPETLQEVADDYDITRERIRQIEARATQKWIRESSWDDLLEHKITRLLLGRQFPLPVAGVEAIDHWFEGVSSHLDFFMNLVRAVCGDSISFIEIDGLYYFSLMDQEMWGRTISEASALLSSGVGQEWSEDYARSLVVGLLPDTAKEFGALLWDKASKLCHFSTNAEGLRFLTSYGRGAEQLVEAILADSSTPLHYTEIAERANLRHGRTLDTRRAHNAAANIGFLFARGTYGVARHVPLSAEQMAQVCAEAEDIVSSEAPGRQWHTSEILLELSERLESGFDGLDKYVLDIALSKSKILRPLGKMTWTTGEEADDQSRIDLHQAVIAIVKDAGRPLKTSEIKERLTAVRGINEFFQIHPTKPLIRLQPGLWGINDRDMPLTLLEQGELVDRLVHVLEERQSGIHASELSRVLPMHECSPDAFLSIAVEHERLKMAQGRYVYLADWGSPRRETIRYAVNAVLEGATGPLTLEEVHSLVENRIERHVDKPVISAALQAQEANFSESTQTWSMDRSAACDSEDEDGEEDYCQLSEDVRQALL